VWFTAIAVLLLTGGYLAGKGNGQAIKLKIIIIILGEQNNEKCT